MSKRAGSQVSTQNAFIFDGAFPVEILHALVMDAMTPLQKSGLDRLFECDWKSFSHDHAFYVSLFVLCKDYYALANSEVAWYKLARYRCIEGPDSFLPGLNGGHWQVMWGTMNAGELVCLDDPKKPGTNKLKTYGEKMVFVREQHAMPENLRADRRYRDYCYALDAGFRLSDLLRTDAFMVDDSNYFAALGYAEWTEFAWFQDSSESAGQLGEPNGKKKANRCDEMLNASFRAASVDHVRGNIFEGGKLKSGRNATEFTDGCGIDVLMEKFQESDEDENDASENSDSSHSTDDSDESDSEDAKSKKKNKKKDDKNSKPSRASLLSEFQKKLEQFPLALRYAEGNNSNCDTIVDGLYFSYGTALGGVLIYKSW